MEIWMVCDEKEIGAIIHPVPFNPTCISYNTSHPDYLKYARDNRLVTTPPVRDKPLTGGLVDLSLNLEAEL